MTLYFEQTGSGPDLVLIHGWGAHGGIWSDLAASLAENFRLTIIDLPGLGRSAALDHGFTLESAITAIKAVTPEAAIWMGWSLGALITMALALSDKNRVKKMILIGGSPCFAKKKDWPFATSSEVLDGFGNMLKTDYRKTLTRFLSLQMGDSIRAREVLRTQRQLLFQYGEPDITALAEMLAVLKETDLRESLSQLDVPTLLIHGERDTLAPVTAANYLERHLPQARLFKIKGAGHVPFLTHVDMCVQAINEFVNNDISNKETTCSS